ncbi:MAG TPA: CehA/McbA family metallohydrolase [Candidatus Acidoferrales bacterium]|nr:CehA/McbA family metallohydrolase [Candidatus Acidoferrales bacterium]
MTNAGSVPRKALLASAAILMLAAVVAADRRPVLPQIELPHPYYFREMYLPQLTTGPSSAAWLPDSHTLVYSMGGTLWRQEFDSQAAEQLTDGPGYDYQPDCSPDGRFLVFTKYNQDALELWLLEVSTKESWPLTRTGAVNVEPRWSPDGKQILWVSTQYNGRFHIFGADFQGGKLQNVQRWTGETRSPLPRYYYSAFDTEISPAWLPGGKEIIFISNRGHIYGSGGFWRMDARPGAEAREIHYEETTWKARPDVSADGGRVVFASYTGRQWHQLWWMQPSGENPLPLTYGDYDDINPRWSPDGKHIVLISNRSGNVQMWTVEVPGGGQRAVVPLHLQYRRPAGELRISVVGPDGKPAPARVSVMGADGRAYAPTNAWMQADDSYDRKERPFEAHYFESAGEESVMIPPGKFSVEVMHGFEYGVERREGEMPPSGLVGVTVRLQKLKLPEEPAGRWVSGDLHVHMNYGGAYRNGPENLAAQARAEDLAVVHSLIVNKEQRVPDESWFSGKLDAASDDGFLLWHGEEFHTSYWGHRGILGLTQHLLVPIYAGYPATASASLAPTNADVADMAHAQGALIGAVHPFEEVPDPADLKTPLHDELPVDVALGKIDYIEVVGFADHKSTAAVWYRLLNLGFRLPTGAGTDAMADFASLRGPVGLNRVFVQMPSGPLQMDAFLDGLKHGRTFATNGPLLRFSLGGQPVGGEVKLDQAGDVPFTAAMASIVPVDHLEIVCNGRVARSLELAGARMSATASGTMPAAASGWCVLRAWSEHAEHPVLDLYPYATTSAVYITVAGRPPHSPEDAAYFLAWIARLREDVEHYPDWNSAGERALVIGQIDEARKKFERLRE